MILASKCSILNYPTHQSKQNSVKSPKHGIIFTRTKKFFVPFLSVCFLVIIATVYKQRCARKISHVKHLSISFHKMYGLIYLPKTIYLLHLIISGYIQTTENFKKLLFTPVCAQGGPVCPPPLLSTLP